MTKLSSQTILFISFLFIFSNSFAQNRCSTTEHMQQLMDKDPTYKKSYQKFQQRVGELPQVQSKTGAVVTIPVVVHVLYSNNTENISDAQIVSQINSLNADFSGTNSDISQVPSVWTQDIGESQIQFCLAQTDPNGNPTDGINRVQTSVSSFGLNDEAKFTSQGGTDAWDVSKYFNIWVCDLGGGVLGYAEFPTGNFSNTYGVVVGYRYFGSGGVAQAPYNKGRTLTHEIGHCLNLVHIWGDSFCGDDLVNDTPTAQEPNYGCPSFPSVSSSCGNGPSGDMFMNYMDYCNDECLYMFTNGQVARMENVLNFFPFTSLVNSNVCTVASPTVDAGIVGVIEPSSGDEICESSITPSVGLRNYGTVELTSVNILYNINGSINQVFSWTGSLNPASATIINLPSINVSSGSNILNVITSSPNGQADADVSNDSKNVSFIVGASTGDNLPFFESFEGNVFPPSGWDINNPDGLATWEQFNQASSNGSKSARKDNFTESDNGQIDDLISPVLNLSSISNPELSFDVAYQLYTDPINGDGPFSDTLVVSVNNDCASNWTEIYRKSSTDLTTVFPAWENGPFTPSNNSEWRTEVIDLSGYTNFSKARIRFSNHSDFENFLYLDAINILSSSSVSARGLSGSSNKGLLIYPNPSKGNINIRLNDNILEFIIYDLLGNQLISQKVSSKSDIDMIDVSNLSNGVYGIYAIDEKGNRFQSNFQIVK